MNETVELFALAIRQYAVSGSGAISEGTSTSFETVDACVAVDGNIGGESSVDLRLTCGVVVSEVKSKASIAAI